MVSERHEVLELLDRRGELRATLNKLNRDQQLTTVASKLGGISIWFYDARHIQQQKTKEMLIDAIISKVESNKQLLDRDWLNRALRGYSPYRNSIANSLDRLSREDLYKKAKSLGVSYKGKTKEKIKEGIRRVLGTGREEKEEKEEKYSSETDFEVVEDSEYSKKNSDTS